MKVNINGTGIMPEYKIPIEIKASYLDSGYLETEKALKKHAPQFINSFWNYIISEIILTNLEVDLWDMNQRMDILGTGLDQIQKTVNDIAKSLERLK